MSLFQGVRRVLRLGAWRRELDDELAFHFDETVAELESAGLSPAQAKEEARRRFGDERRWRRELQALGRRKEAQRHWAARGEVVFATLQHALRRLVRAPGFAAGVMIVFALGIGANATMFSIIDRVLLSPPAHVDGADQVKRILMERREPHTGVVAPVEVLTYPDYLAASESRGLTGVAALAGGQVMFDGDAGMRLIPGQRVTASLFPVLGVRPALGRFFTAEEDRTDAPPVVVIGHSMWQRNFGRRADVLGQTLDFDFGPATIIGVAPKGFTGIDLTPVDVWLPLHAVAGASGNTSCIGAEAGNCSWLRLVGRLAPSADPATVEAEAATRLRRLRAEDIARERLDPEARLLLTPLVAARGPLASGEAKVAVWLGGMSLIVMLVACANIANLLLARATSQEREVGVRLALGSSRGRIVGQALTESLLLALAAGLLAAIVTRWTGVILRDFLLPGIAWEVPGMGVRSAVAIGVLAVIAGLAAGVLPALRSRRMDVGETLRGGGRGISSRPSRTRSTLVIVQAALSVLLLVGAGLFVRSLHQVNQLDLGLDPDGVLSVSTMFEDGVESERRLELVRLGAERLAALPAVEAVSISRSGPFFGTQSTTVRPRGVPDVPTLSTGEPTVHYIDAEYFRVMRLDILRGRGITRYDDERAPPIAVVNETMARVFWPGGEALGQCLELGFINPNAPQDELPCVEVVGVVENARRSRLVEEETMQFYIPAAQTGSLSGPLLVRFSDEAADPAALVSGLLRSLDSSVRYVHLQPLQELIDAQTRSWRLGATLFTAFGLLAVLVASIGLYGVLSFQVVQRTFELGVRAALGASSWRLAWSVLGRALILTCGGVAVGMLGAWLAAPRLRPLLFETSPVEPVVYGAAGALLLAVCVVASLPVARRASRSDPAVALRAE